jgi:CRISPR-associated endonuclease Csn1
MKNNQNDKRKGEYYLGLDVGTNSCGWAVTDKDYNLLKCNGKQMWGARLFDEAQTAEDRRGARTARRRLERRKNRLNLLEMLLGNDILQKDPSFFVRMHDSNLWEDDKTDKKCKYSLFNDPTYNDIDYLKQYPTVYHLRSELIHSDQPHDIRLVYLALHHILKSRGHFLYENSDNSEGKTLDEAIQDLQQFLKNNDIDFKPEKLNEFMDVLKGNDGVTHKKENLKKAYGEITAADDSYADISSLIDLLSGATVKLDKLFEDEELADADLKSISMKDDLDSKADQLSETLGDRNELVLLAKQVFDIARLGQVLGGNRYISDAKVELYNKNKKDLAILKKYVKKHCPQDYKEIFNAQDGIKNFACYSRYKTSERCSQDDFCSFLGKKVKDMKDSADPEEQRIFDEITNKVFLTKLKGTANGLIPYQLNNKELKKILDNASVYWSTLNQKGEDGITVKDKILCLFSFKIPYFVGPLNEASKRHWVVRTNEKIYPWNFSKVVNLQESAEKFMNNLVGRCTYTGDLVMPVNSLLYSEYVVLNEINNIKLNGKSIPVDVKQKIYTDLFVNSRKKVTKKKIQHYLLSNGLMEESDEVSGIDDDIKGTLKSYHDFEDILHRTNDQEQVEKIIERVLVFGNDKKMLKTWLQENTKGLNDTDIRMILHLNYAEWGRLSRSFLTGIYHINADGEAFSIMDMLRNTNNNMMQLLSSQYQFAQKAEEYRKEHYSVDESLHARLDELYIAPSVRRSIWQTMRITDELVDIEKAAPKKIFIEMARTSSKEMKKKRTESRKDALMKLYASCKKDEPELYGKLQDETDQRLRRDKLYLYYTQMGKCMYSGEPIDLDKLLHDDTTYDIDHIFPRSKIKDDSLRNRVLVQSKLNRDKTNTYPISDAVREKMLPFWSMLHAKGLIEPEKYDRLKRNYELTDDELSQFVARQITVTQQSTKALATILNQAYPSARIVYSKAGNVSEFRQNFDIPKFRDVNDLHHAKDAYLNIVVGNVYSTKFTDQFFKNIHAENYSLNRIFDFDTVGAWKAPTKEEMAEYRKETRNKVLDARKVLGGTFTTVYKYVYKNNPIVTFAPFQQKGALYDLQIMPKGKGQLPTKKGMDIKKYGGYNKISGAYYFVVEHTVKKRNIRSIFPVYTYKMSLFNNNPEEYCEDVLGLNNPKIIVNKILNCSMLELDGSRILITGRTNNRNVYKHAYEFSIDNMHAKYLKNLSKYVDRCNIEKKLLPITYISGISTEGNIQMYDWFIMRLNASIYIKLFSNMINDLEQCRDKFLVLDDFIQAKILLEVLKAFKCDRQSSNFKDLNGKGSVGIIAYSSTLSSCNSAFLINQSVTGLFEAKKDLLEGYTK